jgi:hypothetical protein
MRFEVPSEMSSWIKGRVVWYKGTIFSDECVYVYIYICIYIYQTIRRHIAENSNLHSAMFSKYKSYHHRGQCTSVCRCMYYAQTRVFICVPLSADCRNYLSNLFIKRIIDVIDVTVISCLVNVSCKLACL